MAAGKQKMMGLGKGLGALGLKKPAPVTLKPQEVAIDQIKVNPEQPRKRFDSESMQALETSIRQFGLIQPIVVRKVDAMYEIVAGERRFRACQALGFKTVPVTIKLYSDDEVTEIALVENLQRQDLNPIEEAYAYRRLMEVFSLTQEMIGERLGRSRSHIANMIRLLQLPEEAQVDLVQGLITIGQARPVLGLSQVKDQLVALRTIKEKDLNARQAEQLVKHMQEPKREPNPVEAPTEISTLIESIQLSIGTPVAIKLKNKAKVQGTLELTFRNEEELNHILEYMEERRGGI